MQPKNYLILLFLFLTTNCLAQVKFLDGYIVFPSGEKAKVQIEFRDWVNNPEKITARDSARGEKFVYGPGDIAEFEIPGICKYRSAEVTIDVNPIKLEELSMTRKAPVKGNYFLKVLVEGEKANLYELRDFKGHYFIQYGNGEIKELTYAIYLEENGNTKVYKEFRSELKTSNQFTLTEKQIRDADNLEYTTKSLTRFITSVNGKNAVVPGSGQNGKKRVVPFAGVGTVMAKMKYASSSDDLEALKFDPAYGWMITAGVDFLGERDFQKFVLRAEVSYSSVAYKGKGVTEAFSGGTLMYHDYLLDQKNLTPSVTALYQFLTVGKARIYAGVSVEYNFASYSANRLITTNSLSGLSSTREDFPFVEKGWMAYTAKAGVIVNKMIEAGLSWKLNGTMVSQTNVSDKGKRAALWITWKFRKKEQSL